MSDENLGNEITILCENIGNSLVMAVKHLKEKDSEKSEAYLMGVAVLRLFDEINHKTQEQDELNNRDEATEKIHDVVMEKVVNMPEIEVSKIYGL